MSILQVASIRPPIAAVGTSLISAGKISFPNQTDKGTGTLNSSGLARQGLFIRKTLLLNYIISAADLNEINILNIPAYPELLLEWDSCTPSATSTAAGTLTLALSNNNGSSFGTAQNISTNGGSQANGSGLLYGFIKIMNMQSSDNYAICHGTADNKQNESTNFNVLLGGNSGSFGPYNAFKISSVGAAGGGALNTGKIRLYGIA